MNKKGFLLDVIIWVIIGFITIIFFAAWIFSFNLITETLIAVESTDDLNVSDAATKTFGVVNEEMQFLEVIAFIIMFGMALAILLSNFLIKAHPVFFIVHVLMTVIAFIFAVEVSNAYEGLMSNATLGSTLSTTFRGSSFIMLHIPTWVIVIGIVGAIFLFAGIIRDRELGGSVPL